MGYQVFPVCSTLFEYLNKYISKILPYFYPSKNPITNCLLFPNKNGNAIKNVGTVFGTLIEKYIGKYITPGTLRKIVETEIDESNLFSKTERSNISKGLLHDYETAKQYYIMPDTLNVHKQNLQNYNSFCLYIQSKKKDKCSNDNLSIHEYDNQFDIDRESERG